MVRNKKPEAERASQNQEYQENKRSEAEERTKDACSPQKQLCGSRMLCKRCIKNLRFLSTRITKVVLRK
jgi:hypothetical protein